MDWKGLFVVCAVWNLADGSTIWLGKKLVNYMCKVRRVFNLPEDTPVAIKDLRMRQRRTECEWVSWTRCVSDQTERPCPPLQKNTCGKGGGSRRSDDLWVEYQLPKFPSDEHKLKDYMTLDLDHPNAVKGSMSLSNGTLGGFKSFTSRFLYHPINLTLKGEAFFPKFRLVADYKWNIIFFFPGGTAKTLSGAGHLDMTVNNQSMKDMMGKFVYSPTLATYQLGTFDAGATTTDGWTGEVTGATLEGKPATLQDIFFANAASGSHFIPELLRQLLNVNAPRNLPTKHLDLFFTAFLRA